MVARLVLDWDFSHRILAEYVDRSRETLQVITDNTEVVESLRDLGVPVLAADPTDPTVLTGTDSPVQVIAAARDPIRNARIVDAARDAFPTVTVVGFISMHGTPADRQHLATKLDRRIDARDALQSRLLGVANSPATVRSTRVREILTEIDGELAVFTHDNPDPDAIASASALERIATRLDVTAHTYFFGRITHQSNRALVNVLDLDPTKLSRGDSLPDAEAFALVDHANPGVNDSLPPETPIDLIFDHHTPGGPVDARYVDLRESLGATCTIMTEYLRQFHIDPSPSLATALVYGITTDTRSFSRQVAIEDYEAAAFLWPAADHNALARIENPGVTPETLDTTARAVNNRRVEGSVLSACVGTITERDALGQAAELLLQMEDIEISMVYGIVGDVVELSARARGRDIGIDLAAIMREAFAPIGSAGGHEEMAGASVPLGILGDSHNDDVDIVSIVRSVIDERFFETVLTHPPRITEGTLR